MSIDKIEITKMETQTFQDGKATFAINWLVNGESLSGYMGEYTASLYSDKEDVKTITFEDIVGLQQKTLEFSDLNQGTKYTLSLSVPKEQGGKESEKVNAFIDTFQDVSGTFDGENLELTWNLTSDLWLSGICKINYSTGAGDLYKIVASNKILQLKTVKPAPGEYITIVLYVSDNSISTGVKSLPLRFNSTGMKICSAELLSMSEGTQLMVTAKSVYEDLKYAKISLYNNNNQIWTAKPLELVKVEGVNTDYNCTVVIPSSEIGISTIKKCQAKITAIYEEAESVAPILGDTIELQTPNVNVKSATQEGFCCFIDMPETKACPCGFLVENQYITSGNQCVIPYSEYSQGAFSICAQYHVGNMKQSGPHEKTSLKFPSGYYPTVNETGECEIMYKDATWSENQIVIKLNNNLIKNIEDINVEQISLKKDDMGYVLVVDVSAYMKIENLKCFINKLEEQNVGPYSIYQLRDMILRTVYSKQENIPKLLCFMNEEQHWADICPGMGLQIDFDIFMHQVSSENKQTAGYVNVYSECYPVTMRMEDGCLEFDHFATKMARYMSSQPLNTFNTSIITVSGVNELLQANLHQPYYRILYPSILPSSLTEGENISDSFVLLAAGNYKIMNDVCEIIANDPTAIEKLTIPVIMFRGKSNLSLRIKVSINEEELYVPVSTTLGDIFQRKGIYTANEIKMYRYNAKGDKTEVFLNLTEKPEEIVLIGGDSIYFQ